MKGYAVWNPDYNGVAYIHAETRSKARYAILRQARECYPGWSFQNLEVQHVQQLDDMPITQHTLFGIASEDDRYQHTCKCEICVKARGGLYED